VEGMSPEEWLRKEIKRKGLKFKDVSEETGVRYHRIQGSKTMTPDQYFTVCAHLGLDPRGFLHEVCGEDLQALQDERVREALANVETEICRTVNVAAKLLVRIDDAQRAPCSALNLSPNSLLSVISRAINGLRNIRGDLEMFLEMTEPKPNDDQG
jgi:hypothetical protein